MSQTSQQYPAPRPQTKKPNRTYVTLVDARNRKKKPVCLTVYNATPSQVKALLTASPERSDTVNQPPQPTQAIA